MTSLLVGCETVLYMANRLKAYMIFLHGLPATLTRTNFEIALTILHARILKFLAYAIQIYQTPTLKRAFKAFWEDSDVQDFEQECDKLGYNLEIEASNCDRILRGQDRERAEKLKRNLDGVLEELKKLHHIQYSLNQLEIKIDLGKLPYAKGAMFNSYDQDHTTCHPATRVDVLHQIHDWAQQLDSKSIFWLSGMAGVGKSTISWTLAEWLTGQGRHGVVDLGASFFFKRGEGDRRSASRFFSTITRDLVLKVPRLDRLVAEVITSNPTIFDKALGEQFDKLIYQPLQKVDLTLYSCPTLVVVVDALDECEKERDVKAILDLWSQLPQITTIRLKLFLTSRPDFPILQGFKNMSVDTHRDMILHDEAEVPPATIQHDISAFLKDRFLGIRKTYNTDPLLGTPLGHDWPGNTILQALADMAIPLFIVAATVCRYVGDSNFNPEERLKEILKFRGMGQLEQMEQIYLPVVSQLPATLSESRDKEKLYQDFRKIVGSIITLAEPLSATSLAILLDMRRDTIMLRLRPLHSVLRVPVDHEALIRTLHLSFSEFLLSEKVQHQPFGVDGPATHRILLMKCLELLSRPNGLRENLCDLSYPGQPRRGLDSSLVNEHLSSAVQYACQYWVYHAQQSKIQIDDDDIVHVFLQKHFLHWLEALSLMNRLTEVIGYIGVLQTLVSVSKLPEGLYRQALALTYG